MTENQTPGPIESEGEPTFEDVVRVGKVESDGQAREGLVQVRTAVSRMPSGWGHLFNTVERETEGRWRMGYSTNDSKVQAFVPSADLLGELEAVVEALDERIAATNKLHRETVLPIAVAAWEERVQDERDRRSLAAQVKKRLKDFNDSQET